MKEIIKKVIPRRFLGIYHFSLAFLGAFFYRYPSKRLKVIGVTGTNGKTTVTEMISKILEDGGFRVALLNSIRFKIGALEKKNNLRMTMPGRFKLQKFLREAVDSSCQYVVLEVTSEGIKQHRHKFIDFSLAVFTNLSPEHIEAHGSFEKYREAKGEFFKSCKGIHVINQDDPNAPYFLQFPAAKKILYSLKDSTLLSGEIKLLGEFNIYNAIASLQVGLSQGIDLAICQRAIEKFDLIPGRMELVINQSFKVFVDYAFTPNALEQVYKALTSKFMVQGLKLICVLGSCGGGRDKWKRPVLGEIASRYCQDIIVTNEDPYDENPMEIIDQVAEGTKGKALKILDRREAIKEALKLAKTGDVVIITGKGSEPSICLAGGKKIP
ncbi:MAG: UDP-N-acetylmuramoyl-L-alanyl-D-glutamate--2,6-diaminopimelate ligase, partial [Patescibacteria group bacterium]